MRLPSRPGCRRDDRGRLCPLPPDGGVGASAVGGTPPRVHGRALPAHAHGRGRGQRGVHRVRSRAHGTHGHPGGSGRGAAVPGQWRDAHGAGGHGGRRGDGQRWVADRGAGTTGQTGAVTGTGGWVVGGEGVAQPDHYVQIATGGWVVGGSGSTGILAFADGPCAYRVPIGELVLCTGAELLPFRDCFPLAIGEQFSSGSLGFGGTATTAGVSV